MLFVCMGNICRSPAAEGVFRHFLNNLGLKSQVEVDSAGTIASHAGDSPDSRMRKAARRRGYQLEGRSRVVEDADLVAFDLVVAMDRENYRDLVNRSWGNGDIHRTRICLLSEFLNAEWPQDVPDPYYGGPWGFERVLDMIEAACPAILRDLSSGQA